MSLGRQEDQNAKHHKPEETVAKLRQVDVLTSQGKSVADAIRALGVTEVTYYRWRQEYGGLRSDQVERLKDLEAENTRLRRAVSDLALTRDPRRGCTGKLLSPARRRGCIDHIRSELRLSERPIFRGLGQHRSTQRRVPTGQTMRSG
jgi:putative transposase